MNEDIPPFPPKVPEEPVMPPAPSRVGPAPWLGGLIGLLTFVGSAVLCYFSPIFLLFGFAGAVVSLFFKGYRSIFLGYILTIGVTLLGVIIYCSTHPFDMK